MNLGLIRIIDSKVGAIVCKYLYHYEKFRTHFPPLRQQEGLKRILIIKFWGIGNLVQASPTLRAMRRKFPEAHIVFLTLSQNKGVYEKGGLYDEAIYLRLTTLWDFMRELFKLFFVLRGYRFDLIVNLEPLIYFAEIITFYVGVGHRVGFAVPGRKTLFTKEVEFREDEHIARTFYRMLEVFGIDNEPTEEDLLPERIPLTAEAEQAAQELLLAEDAQAEDFIVGVNVNASDVAIERRWPLENFAALIDMIIQQLHAKVVLFGAPDEVPYVERAIAMMRETPINLAGRTSLLEAIALIARIHIFVTNDTGPLHLAYAQGIPTVSFYGPESPRRYGPLGSLHRPIYKDLDCSPCIFFKNLKKINCKRDALCMKSISVHEAFQHVAEIHQLWLKQKAPKKQSRSPETSRT
ncbi:MAG: glycosyltransferase family 9 protein [bacterium]